MEPFKSFLRITILLISSVYFPMDSSEDVDYLTPFNRWPSTGSYNETAEYLINTPGCHIPNYMKKMNYHHTWNTSRTNCGKRLVFVDLLPGNMIKIRMDKEMAKYRNLKCCYQFVRRMMNKRLRYSNCMYYKNGTVTPLYLPGIIVTCFKVSAENRHRTLVYTDKYLIFKEIHKTDHEKAKPSPIYFNVVMVGMDTMSRRSVYKTMPRTLNFIKNNNWIDYRGYNKIGAGTYQNLMAVLTGKNLSPEEHNDCYLLGLRFCNRFMIWTHYKMAGYVTNFGRELVFMDSNVFFRTPPSEEEPYFETGQRLVDNVYCTGKQSSVEQLLNYAINYTSAHITSKFFGFFWFNGVGDGPENRPQPQDADMKKFLKKLTDSDVKKNTFVLFFSDDGLRNENTPTNSEIYYEERLPMMFIHVPLLFRELFKGKYYYLGLNANRLTSPYDLHATLWDILKISNSSVNVSPPEGCPRCRSLFHEKPINRVCLDAAIQKKWCSCKELGRARDSNITERRRRCQETAVSYIGADEIFICVRHGYR